MIGKIELRRWLARQKLQCLTNCTLSHNQTRTENLPSNSAANNILNYVSFSGCASSHYAQKRIGLKQSFNALSATQQQQHDCCERTLSQLLEMCFMNEQFIHIWNWRRVMIRSCKPTNISIVIK